MKGLRKSGVGINKQQSEAITYEEEETLWQKGILGDDRPDVLRDTMVWMCGMFFALRGGGELRQLKMQQLSIKLLSNGDKYLQYCEMGSKNNPGGLHQRRINNKVVPHYQNKSDPSRDFVRLYEKYISKGPPLESRDSAFFLHSLSKPTSDRWYANRPVGHNYLASVVKRMCASGGIAGKKTNHSLRASAATRLFQSGVDEQLIMEVTGHRSTDGIRSYKRTSPSQFKDVSKILQQPSCTEPVTEPVNKKEDKNERDEKMKNETKEDEKKKNEMRKDQSGLNFFNCSNITINLSK